MYSLQVEDIHKRYGSHEVLRGVSLRAGKGDVISIIGSSGSGKSTFLRCVNFLEKPCAGRIRVGDEELRTRPGALGELRAADPRQLQKIRSRLAMVFQHFNLWSHLTVLENVVECPVNVLRMNRDDAVAARATTWPRSAWRRRSNGSIPANSPAASNSAWRSPAPWPWSRR